MTLGEEPVAAGSGKGEEVEMRETGIRSVGVVGAGSWGTALANLLGGKGLHVDLWAREDEVVEQILRYSENRVFLPGILLSRQIRPTLSFREAVVNKQVVLLAVPSHVFREVLGGVSELVEPDACVVIATKGIENGTLMVMSQVAESMLSSEQMRRFSCLTGPSFAKDVSLRLPTAVMVACGEKEQCAVLQRLFFTDFFRVYAGDDLMGAQLGGALKNVMAIAAGASDGLGFGSNARAALITRGLAEMTRLGVALGARNTTFAGLAGLGDLVLTCTGEQSRNRTVGFQVGKGMKLQEITRDMKMVAEGIRTARSAYELSVREKIDMPITAEVYRILYEGKAPEEAVKDLMNRDLKAELW